MGLADRVLRRLRVRPPPDDALARLRRSAVVGAHVKCGPETLVSLVGAAPSQVVVGDHVHLLGAELRCYARGRIAIGDACWFSLRTQIIACSGITIGRHNIFGRDVYISDTNEHPLDADVRRAQTLALLHRGELPDRYAADTAPIALEDDVWVGERAMILKGVRIGRGAVVAAGAVVTKDVPPMTVVAGNPARVVKTIA